MCEGAEWPGLWDEFGGAGGCGMDSAAAGGPLAIGSLPAGLGAGSFLLPSLAAASFC